MAARSSNIALTHHANDINLQTDRRVSVLSQLKFAFGISPNCRGDKRTFE